MKKLLNNIIGENGRFMKYIVVYCLFFSSCVILLCYIASWFGVDTGDVLTATTAIFGFNLVSTLIIKITENRKESTANKAEEKKG